jgi:FtsP/CotA-like multicopper oxidase with cupredoxin domain
MHMGLFPMQFHIHKARLCLASSASSVFAFVAPWFAAPNSPVGDPPPSPRVTPFLAPLPIPAPARSASPFASTAVTPAGAGSPAYYELVAEARSVRLHPELPPTRVWGYRDAAVASSSLMLGPTLVQRSGQPILVRYRNELPRDHVGFGLTDTVIHYHGAHLPAQYDGFPENIPGYQAVVSPGQTYDYCIPGMSPGAIDGPLEDHDRPATMWYHDHVLDFTAQNVYRGLAGMFLFFDELDTGDETTGLCLPSGEFDVPLVLQDRRLDAQGQLWYDPLDHNGFLGDLFLVNGVVQPFHEVKARKHRLRLLNGCNARFLTMRLRTAEGRAVPFDVIGNEGGLFSRTLRAQSSVLLSPAKRYDIVVDFSQFAPGTQVFLENVLDQTDGRGPKGTLDKPVLKPSPDRFLQFRVGAPTLDSSQTPDTLRPFPMIADAEIAAATRRTIEFGRRNGVWVINGEPVDLERPLFTAQRGQGEVWTLRNSSGGWWHPIHAHLEFVRILRRNGLPPTELERDGVARSDTVILGANDEVEVFVKFRDFPGRWVMHCHTIEHEDAYMMTCFDLR